MGGRARLFDQNPRFKFEISECHLVNLLGPPRVNPSTAMARPSQIRAKGTHIDAFVPSQGYKDAARNPARQYFLYVSESSATSTGKFLIETPHVGMFLEKIASLGQIWNRSLGPHWLWARPSATCSK